MKKIVAIGSENNCAICLEELDDPNKPTIQEFCQPPNELLNPHRFHESCIARWLINHAGCPLSRQPTGIFGMKSQTPPTTDDLRAIFRDLFVLPHVERDSQRSFLRAIFHNIAQSTIYFSPLIFGVRQTQFNARFLSNAAHYLVTIPFKGLNQQTYFFYSNDCTGNFDSLESNAPSSVNGLLHDGTSVLEVSAILVFILGIGGMIIEGCNPTRSMQRVRIFRPFEIDIRGLSPAELTALRAVLLDALAHTYGPRVNGSGRLVAPSNGSFRQIYNAALVRVEQSHPGQTFDQLRTRLNDGKTYQFQPVNIVFAIGNTVLFTSLVVWMTNFVHLQSFSDSYRSVIHVSSHGIPIDSCTEVPEDPDTQSLFDLILVMADVGKYMLPVVWAFLILQFGIRWNNFALLQKIVSLFCPLAEPGSVDLEHAIFGPDETDNGAIVEIPDSPTEHDPLLPNGKAHHNP